VTPSKHGGGWIVANNSTRQHPDLGGTTPTVTVNTLGADKSTEISAEVAERLA